MSAGPRNIWAIVVKEWHHYFGSAIGYVTLAVWSLIFGWFFSMDLVNFLEESEARPVSLNDTLLRSSFGGLTRRSGRLLVDVRECRRQQLGRGRDVRGRMDVAKC